jgi:hypothetical protein
MNTIRVLQPETEVSKTATIVLTDGHTIYERREITDHRQLWELNRGADIATDGNIRWQFERKA